MTERSTRSRSRFARWPITLAVLVGLSGGLLVSVPLNRLIDGDSRRVDQPTQPVEPSEAFTGQDVSGRAEIVVLGRDRQGMSTDVILTVRVEGGRTFVTQIPRDSYIEVDGFGGMKINALMAYGGIEAVEQELTRLMNRPIRSHIVVNLDAIQTLANMVGGIHVDVPKRLYYVDTRQNLVIDLQPGPQLLKGNDLEGFLRWRNDERGDFGRLDRQKLVLQGLLQRLKQPQHLIRLPFLVSSARELLKTDLGPIEMGTLMTSVGTSEMEVSRLNSVPFNLGGISYLNTEWPNHAARRLDANPSTIQERR